MAYELWREITLTVGTLVALVGFLRGQEHRKDGSLNDLGIRLANSDSAMMRASAATQLPAFFSYRRYFLLNYPYRPQALNFVLNGLKVENEAKFVRQALIDALGEMLRKSRRHSLTPLNLIDAKLDELIIFGFRFDKSDLTQAILCHSDLGDTSFINAKLWRADLSHAKLTNTDFTDAQLWDTNFSHANLENSLILTPHVNEQTRFEKANLKGAKVSPTVAEVCNLNKDGGIQIEGSH